MHRRPTTILASSTSCSIFFFFNATATTEIYTLSLHDALPIFAGLGFKQTTTGDTLSDRAHPIILERMEFPTPVAERDRKSTRLNSSHPSISYAVFCLKKKKNRNRA